MAKKEATQRTGVKSSGYCFCFGDSFAGMTINSAWLQQMQKQFMEKLKKGYLLTHEDRSRQADHNEYMNLPISQLFFPC